MENAMSNNIYNITPVILCGGSGTRLWPLSRKSFPKQFVPLFADKSLLQLTLDRLSEISKQVICVASEDHRFFVDEAIAGAKLHGSVLLESSSRNTAAAMAIAALSVNPSEMLLFCPADHHIPDTKAFAQSVHLAKLAAQEGCIVTFGVQPTLPSSAYGYIRQGISRSDGLNFVAEFIEKPAKEKAEALLLGGQVLWNAGIFLCKAQTLLAALDTHAKDILQTCQQAIGSARHDGHYIRPNAKWFDECRAESIDYAVMEKAENITVIPLNCAWSDVGSWSAVADLTPVKDDGNRIQGQGYALQSSNIFVHAPHRPVVVLGAKDLHIIDTPDALLVVAQSHVEQVKQAVALLESKNISQSKYHRKVARPWGNYDSLDVGPRHQVKRITLRPGAKLSLQMHHHRAEHWVVVKGTAMVTRGDEKILLSENQSTYIPLGVVHRLENPGKTELELIEVQSGSYLGEDDIVRFEDSYGRELDLTKGLVRSISQIVDNIPLTVN
jgi:mannose-1-phosphate guanylyltransferase/mannose-6-phosphate isomerase